MNIQNKFVHFITISADEAGQRIDNFLHKYLKGMPQSMIYRIVRKGEVRVNKKRIKHTYKIKNNDQVRIPPIMLLKKNSLSISKKLNKMAALNDAIIYEDDYLLVLNKPTGIAVHGGSNINFGVIESLRLLRPSEHFLELVHRLDRETSGVLLVAKKRSALRILHEQLRTKNMQKYYLALVRGQWQLHLKKIAEPLLKNTQANKERIVIVTNNGKPSETSFQVKEQFQCATLVLASPITGRTHQIRVHAQYSGHPIALDRRYGDSIFDQQLKKICGLHRLFLHATALQFIHPGNGEILRIEAPLDTNLHQCLLYLRANYKYLKEEK